MTDKDVVDRFALLVGTPSVYATRKQKPHHKQAWRTQVCGPRAIELMKFLRPRMGVRRQQQIDRAILARETRKTGRKLLSDPDIRARFESGEKATAIAASLGCTREAVYRSLRRSKSVGLSRQSVSLTTE